MPIKNTLGYPSVRLPSGLLSTGNNHSSHGSEPHYVGGLQEVHPCVPHPSRQSAAAAQIHLTDSGQVHQGKDQMYYIHSLYRQYVCHIQSNTSYDPLPIHIFFNIYICIKPYMSYILTAALCLQTAPEQRLPRAGPGVRHQQPCRAPQLGQPTRRDVHTGQQHRPGQTVLVFPLQKEHPEVNKG